MSNSIEKQEFEEPSEELDKLAEQIVGSAYQVHKNLGPGLLERFYRDSMVFELEDRGLKVDKEVSIPIFYKGKRLDGHYIIDLLVEDNIIVELKTVEELSKLHKAQLNTYLKISGHRLGILINFNSTVVEIKRVLNKIEKQ